MNSESDPSRWVDLFGDYLFRFALLRVHDRVLAEDLVQDTFLAALKDRHKYAGNAALRTWLTGILKNKIVDQFRKTSKSLTKLSGFYQAEMDQCFDGDDHWRIKQPTAPKPWIMEPESKLVRREFRLQLKACLDKLPEKLRQVFCLRDIDGMASDEICARLDISKANLWTLMHRARFSLRRCLDLHWFSR